MLYKMYVNQEPEAQPPGHQWASVDLRSLTHRRLAPATHQHGVHSPAGPGAQGTSATLHRRRHFGRERQERHVHDVSIAPQTTVPAGGTAVLYIIWYLSIALHTTVPTGVPLFSLSSGTCLQCHTRQYQPGYHCSLHHLVLVCSAIHDSTSWGTTVLYIIWYFTIH